MACPDLHPSSIINRAEGLVSTTIDDEIVILSIESGMYYGIDCIGSRIWDLIKTPTPLSVIIETLMEEFDVSRPTCEKDVFAFLTELQQEKVITVTA